jgi:hypothetical protein
VTKLPVRIFLINISESSKSIFCPFFMRSFNYKAISLPLICVLHGHGCCAVTNNDYKEFFKIVIKLHYCQLSKFTHELIPWRTRVKVIYFTVDTQMWTFFFVQLQDTPGHPARWEMCRSVSYLNILLCAVEFTFFSVKF